MLNKAFIISMNYFCVDLAPTSFKVKVQENKNPHSEEKKTFQVKHCDIKLLTNGAFPPFGLTHVMSYPAFLNTWYG